MNVKKGQFLAPWDVGPLLEKVASTGNRDLLVTERGASFGYNNLVADMRSLAVMAGFGYPVVYDAGHSVQLPGGQGGASGGQRQFIRPLARAAVAVGVDAVFLETHEDPDRALSDGPNSYPLAELPALLAELQRIDAAASQGKPRAAGAPTGRGRGAAARPARARHRDRGACRRCASGSTSASTAPCSSSPPAAARWS